jgi:flagellar biosynthesis protein FlhF
LNSKHSASEIRRLVEKRKESVDALKRFLVLKGISSSLAEEITLELLSEGKKIVHIKEKIMQRLRVTGELPFDKPHRLVFIGPTGVGKTTAIKKLASHYLRYEKTIALACLDEAKKKELENWANERRIPFLTEPSSQGYELLLIDTEGCNFYQPNRIEILGGQLGMWEEGAELILTLSAAAKEVDLYGAIHQFSHLNPTSLMFTKLDETLAAAVLVNVCAKTDLPIRYIAFGYPLPGDLQIADIKLITHKVLTDFNEEEFQTLRQLSALN